MGKELWACWEQRVRALLRSHQFYRKLTLGGYWGSYENALSALPQAGQRSMDNPLLGKFNTLFGLNVAVEALHGLDLSSQRQVPPNRDILTAGDEVAKTVLLLGGMACRYKMMANGRRAIVGFLVPGDFTNLPFSSPQRLDFGVGALTLCEVVALPCVVLEALAAHNSPLGEALWACIETDAALERAWLANLSQCTADQRLAHLLCELRWRLEAVGLADRESVHLPIRQQDLADAMGISTVHVNRVLHDLKENKLIRATDHTFFIPDLGRLEYFAGFDAGGLRNRYHHASFGSTSFSGCARGS
jgi:CRP-like cAMP-binding protein